MVSYIEHALDAGDLLDKAKKETGHGRFRGWVEAHCKMGYSTARLYRQLARNRAAIEAEVSLRSGLGLRDALRIANGKSEDKLLTVSNLSPAAPAAAKIVADALAPLKRITHLDLLEMWKRAPAEVRTRFIDSVGVRDLVAHAPSTWRLTTAKADETAVMQSDWKPVLPADWVH
jgi:hypothetical protein